MTLEMTMFRSTRDDTLIKTVEARYGIDLHARADAKLGNLLEKRGFESLTQLLKAYRGDLTYHACKRRIYLSFHVEDLPRVRGFRLMARAPNLEIDFHDGSLREVIDSTRGSYIKATNSSSHSEDVCCRLPNRKRHGLARLGGLGVKHCFRAGKRNLRYSLKRLTRKGATIIERHKRANSLLGRCPRSHRYN
jgi:hypothetical protein